MVSHGKQIGLVKGQVGGIFILELFMPDGLTATPRSGRVTPLYHKAFDNTVEDQPVVVAVLDMGNKVLYSQRSCFGKEFQFDLPDIGLQYNYRGFTLCGIQQSHTGTQCQQTF